VNAKTALENIVGLLGDYQSFSEGFDHGDHGDDVDSGDEDRDCRFEQYDIDESLEQVTALIDRRCEGRSGR